jgi:predicted TIM-barrel fold metal-dependent hydrolase
LIQDLKQLDITRNKYFDIDVLERILDENKDMPVILETSLKQCMLSRYYFSLLERFENLYLEISGLLLYDQIEHYIERYGSKRLIFGSNFPNLSIEITTNRIILAEISEIDKENIAFKNIKNIIRSIEIG